ncbi:hypothetical protein ACHAXT_007446 [Thalassiosira profunda]
MDALAGYGSDSASDDDANPTSGGALSGLLAHYSDESDGEGENDAVAKQGARADAKVPATAPKEPAGKDGGEEKVTGGGGGHQSPGMGDDGKPAQKRRRRWDNPHDNENGDRAVDANSVLPPPPLLAATNDKEGGADPFQSMMHFKKDYTIDLRRKLAQQMQQQQKAQGTEQSTEKRQLGQRLQQLHEKFHATKVGSTDNPPAPSFAAHLKSQHEFGNPHLLKTIIDHFDISPLESHSGNAFKRFEDIERLASAEERARIAKANYDAGLGSGGNAAGGGVPGLPGPGA